MSNPIQTQVTSLANQLKTAVLNELNGLKLTPDQATIIEQATNTLADVALNLPLADEANQFYLKTRASMAQASLEDVLAAELQNAAAAASRLQTQVITLSTAFVTKVVEVGLTVALAGV